MQPQMNTDERRQWLNQISERIIQCAYEVSNTLGCGFLEKVYENAPAVELRGKGMDVVQQKPLSVRYKRTVVGEYVADIIVEDAVIIETKACKAIDQIHMAQCLSYLKATGKHLALLLNFGAPKVQIKRMVNKF